MYILQECVLQKTLYCIKFCIRLMKNKLILFFMLICGSVFAQTSQRAVDEALVSKIMEAKQLLDENPYSSTAGFNVFNILDPLEEQVKKSKVKNLSDSYYATLMHVAALMGNTNDIDSYFEHIDKPDETAVYLECLYFVGNNNYKDCEQFMAQYLYKNGKRYFENKELALLYAQVLAKQKKYEASSQAYEKIGLDNLDAQQTMNLAKVYYNQQKYNEAIQLLQNTKYAASDYMLGLCYLSTSKWKEANSSFNSYLNKNNSKAPYYELSHFYMAYSTYKLGNYKESYTNFSDFADSTSELALARQAYELAAKSAVLFSDYTKAAKQAEKLIQISFKEDDIHNAVLFCAEIYTECKNYDKAISTLNPYLNEHSDFGATCQFTLAQIYEKSGAYLKADSVYQQIMTVFDDKDIAEEAAYKDSEIFYIQNDYSTAGKKYTTYITKYPRGKYIEAAYYFGGECYLRCKEYNLSIMNSKNLVTKYPSSVYMYGANKNLFQAYYESGDYSQAQKTAKILMNSYNAQAVQDGIPYQLKVLNSIVEGNKKEVAEKQAEIERYGGLETKAGRLAGFELFNLYAAEGSSEQALALAKRLQTLADTKSSEESYGLGQITEYMADNSTSEKQPGLYIKAAEYYRSSGKDNGNGASVLYKAVSAFLELQQPGDAKETAKTLKKLYPESRQAKSVDALF